MSTTTETRARTAVIVLNWNGWRDTIPCIESLRAMQDVPSVFVVDNGSSDDSVARIRSAAPWAALVLVASNRGFGAGMNAGMAAALELDPPCRVRLGSQQRHSGAAGDALTHDRDRRPRPDGRGGGKPADRRRRVRPCAGSRRRPDRPVARHDFNADPTHHALVRLSHRREPASTPGSSPRRRWVRRTLFLLLRGCGLECPGASRGMAVGRRRRCRPAPPRRSIDQPRCDRTEPRRRRRVCEEHRDLPFFRACLCRRV